MILSLPELLITSSVLILALTALRAVLRGRISPKLQYALWALVLVRLLVPFSPESPLSVMNAADRVSQQVHVITLPEQSAGNAFYETETAPVAPAARPSQGAADSGGAEGAPQASAPALPPLRAVLAAVWLCGAAACAVWLLWCNLRFGRTLRRTRKVFDGAVRGTDLPVYTAEGLFSPCLFGLPHPAIYLPAHLCADEAALRHILLHEEMHYRQRDHLWSALRGVCLCLYWFDPLVWLAAILSRRDCELSCDARTIAALGEGQRLNYGRTLLSLMARPTAPGDLLCAATTMTGGEESRRARIAAIAAKPHMKKITAAVVLAVAAVCIITTFTVAAGGGRTLYKNGAVTVGIPGRYTADVLVLTDAPAVAGDSAVVWVYDKETWRSHAEEDAATPTPGDTGWLFAIERAGEVDYEAHLMAAGEKDVAYFAKDKEGAYYLCRFPLTDNLNPGRADYFSGLRTAVCNDFIRRNGLTAVDETELWGRDYTYESQEHVVMTYAAGSTGEITLTLSRPATDGNGGIWCVERWSDSNGVHLNFPVESGLCSRDYYAQLQMACDEGLRPDLLDSTEVVLVFLTERNILVDSLSMSTGFMSEVNHFLADMQQRRMRRLLENTAHKEVMALLSGDLGEEDLVYQSAELCARYPLTDTLTVSAWQVWFTIPDDIAVPAPLRPGNTDGGSRSVAAGFFLTVSESGGKETYLSYLPRTENRQAAPRYADVAAESAEGGYVTLSSAAADTCIRSTATVEYAPFGADNEARYVLTLTRPATDGDGGIWHVSRVRCMPGGDYVAYPFSGNTSFPEEIARTQVSSDTAPDAYADWRDPKQVALKWLRDFAGEDTAAENITAFSRTDAAYTTESAELQQRAEADMKDALLARTDITPEQLQEVSFAHCGAGVAYGGLADRPVCAWPAVCFIPEEITLPDGFAEGRYAGQRTAGLGWYVKLPISDGSSSWVLLPLSEGTDAPSYTDIARRMGKYILPLSSPDDT